MWEVGFGKGGEVRKAESRRPFVIAWFEEWFGSGVFKEFFKVVGRGFDAMGLPDGLFDGRLCGLVIGRCGCTVCLRQECEFRSPVLS